MPVRRVAIPTATKNQVLEEFRHRCAICGADKPHLHHIDENPQNNDPFNILPLCPNCHLTDQHNPTERIPAEILRLFRKFKSPAILSPQFRPLFARLRFLSDVVEVSDAGELEASAVELASFVTSLEMGDFYGSKIRDLTKRVRVHVVMFDLGRGVMTQESKMYSEKKDSEFREALMQHRDEVVALCVELLRYQKW